MKISRNIYFLLLIAFYSCHNGSHEKRNNVSTVTAIKDSTDEESLWRTCSFSNQSFAYKIDSCNCGDVYATRDTIFIYLFPAEGGEVQGRLLNISYPKCDSNYYILRKHQNRYYTSSMGPDPVYTDWILYNSNYDTIKYDSKRDGFFIDSIPEVELEKFPKFDTLDFYKAYKRGVGNNLNSDDVPGNAKAALYSEYKRASKDIKDALERSSAELHRIFLILRNGDTEIKVIVFTYGHFG